MRAVTIRAYGGPEQVRVDDVPRPEPRQPDDVVVRLRCAALNHLDLFVLSGLPGVKHEFPWVLGGDGAGVVEAVGPAVTSVQPGDQVLINPGLWCNACRFCEQGEHSLCETYRLLGEHAPGTFAEAVRLPERNVERLEGAVDWAKAAAFPLSHLTAWRMLANRAAVQAGEHVLIWGIGGGVALAALDVAKHLGAVVTVTSGSDEKLARARALGADHAINHATADVPRELRRLTGRRGADVVVDNVGTATWEHSTRALARGGRLVTCGGTSGPMVTTDVRKLFWHHWTILGSTMGNAREFAAITRLFTAGHLAPVVDHVYPLDQARAAFERMQRGEQFGKIVLRVEEA